VWRGRGFALVVAVVGTRKKRSIHGVYCRWLDILRNLERITPLVSVCGSESVYTASYAPPRGRYNSAFFNDGRVS
jgi:hypothetical protein